MRDLVGIHDTDNFSGHISQIYGTGNTSDSFA